MKNFKDSVWKENVDHAVKEIKKYEIKFVRLQFTDINGIIKNLAVSSKNIVHQFIISQSWATRPSCF